MARRLLAAETGAHGTPGDAVAATSRVLGQLHEELAIWFGRDGSQAVLARALDRARAGHPALLSDARLEFQGEHRRPTLSGLTELAGTHDPVEVTAALVALIAAVLALLGRLIGADLVARLVQQAWPNGSAAPRADHPILPRMPHEDVSSD